MDICIFGAGSLGSALGGLLSTKHSVSMVGRQESMLAVRKHGLRLVGDARLHVHPVAVETVSELEPPRLLIVCTKAYDTKVAVEACRRLVDERTMVLTLQNGLGNLEILRHWRGDRAFGGTTTLGAALVSPGVVRISGLGTTVVGSDADASGARTIASALRSIGLAVRVKKSIVGEIWGKAVVNACINPTAAILRVPNGMLLESRPVSRLMREISRECERVAQAEMIELPHRQMYRHVRAVCESTSKNLSSMLQDVRNGKRTEIEQINGAFCDIGNAHGVQTPLNQTLVSIVESLEAFSGKEKG